jgi:phospholipid/cholesterol/gamma-HCH transport system substrate-binding protein
MKWSSLRVAIVVGAAVPVVILFTFPRPLGHWQTLKTYFDNGMALRAGAPVRFAGVDIGSVKAVRPRPEIKDTPIEVVMSLNTAEELKIPNDSTVSLKSAGFLGETFVEIDSHTASGPPVQSGGTLKAVPTTALTTEQLLERIATTLNLSKTEETLDKLDAVLRERCNDKAEDMQKQALKTRKVH